MAGTRTSSQRFYGSPTSPTSPGTGGGTGSGSVSVSSGGYDRYTGTIGLAADAPANAIFSHYTEFPAANKYDWVRVVSEATINGIDLLIGQNWICTADKTAAGTSSKWELFQKGEKKPQYATYANCIGYIRREIDITARRNVPNTGAIFIPFRTATGTGVFEPFVRNDPDPRLYATDLYILPNDGLEIDFSLLVQYSFDISGDRGVSLQSYVYYPTTTNSKINKFATLLNTTIIEAKNTPASQRGTTDILLYRPRRRTVVIPQIDSTPLTYSVAAAVYQNSAASIDITFAELTIVAWK